MTSEAKRYVAVCAYYKEQPVVDRDGDPDATSLHATEIAVRWEQERLTRDTLISNERIG